MKDQSLEDVIIESRVGTLLYGPPIADNVINISGLSFTEH
jgi:hypothetical protein